MWERWVRRTLLIVTIALASSLAYHLFTRSASISTTKPLVSYDTEAADASIKDFVFTQTKDGTVQWEVRAKKAKLFEQENRADLQQVTVTLYNKGGKDLTLEGDEGTFDTIRKDFLLVKRGAEIIVTTQSGYTIITNHLLWNEDRQEIMTSDPVTITGHGLQVNGRGLQGKLRIEEFEVLDDVQVAIEPVS
jgi:lipopolysaccharide export system protein LptC